MDVSLNAVPVLLALALVLKYISAETSAASSATSAPSSTTSTASTTTGPTNPTSAANTTSTTSEAPSARSATEKWEELEGCFGKRQCDNVTCEECSPEDVYCARRCKQKCRCSCGGYEISTDPDLWMLMIVCMVRKDCLIGIGPDRCSGSCSGHLECQHECELTHLQCECECLEWAAHAKDSVAITTTTATSCSRADEILQWDCWEKCVADFCTEYVNGSDDEGECMDRMSRKIHNCACACAGLPSATDYDHLVESKECVAEAKRNGETCRRTTYGPNTDPERYDWCRVFEHRRRCACLAAGAAGSSGAAEYRMGTKDKEQLLRCAEAWKCDYRTCDCHEGDEACVDHCKESCRCNKCLSFPAAGPGAQPEAGGLTVMQCRDKRDACVASCPGGDTDCRDGCYVEEQACRCKCSGRSSPARPTPIVTNPPVTDNKKTETVSTDRGDKEIVMHCNYLS